MVGMYRRQLQRWSRSIALVLAGPLLWAQDPCRQGGEALARQEFSRAEELLLRCLDFHPAHYPAYLQLCGLYQRQGREEDLNRVAEQGLRRFPQELRFYLVVGLHAGRKGDYDRAVEVLTEGARRWPEVESLQKNLMEAYVARGLERLDQGENEAAAADLRRVLELDSENTEALLNLGRALHNLNRSVEALEIFDRAAAIDPSLPLIHFHRGLVLSTLGEYEEALSALDRQLQLDPEHPPSYYFRGLCHQYKAEWEKAAADFRRAVAKMPDHSLAYHELGRSLEHLGRHQEAEEAFRHSLRLNPSDPKVLYALGRLLLRRGEREEARVLFQRAGELHSQNRSAAPGEIRFQSSGTARP